MARPIPEAHVSVTQSPDDSSLDALAKCLVMETAQVEAMLQAGYLFSDPLVFLRVTSCIFDCIETHVPSMGFPGVARACLGLDMFSGPRLV